MSTNHYVSTKTIMEDSTTSYIKYLISNLVLLNDWIEKFEIGSDKDIIQYSNNIASEISNILTRMHDLGIEVESILDESYDIDKNIRDFKIKRILTNDQ